MSPSRRHLAPSEGTRSATGRSASHSMIGSGSGISAWLAGPGRASGGDGFGIQGSREAFEGARGGFTGSSILSASPGDQ
eukprot:4856394-Pyramimonas_sp.AAC.1